MCNSGRHQLNTSQFFVTFDPTPWMAYRYVAFGQLLQGAKILQLLENLQTDNEYVPIQNVYIAKCGELTMDAICKLNTEQEITEFLQNILICEPSAFPDTISIDFNTLRLRDLYKEKFYKEILDYLKRFEGKTNKFE